MLALWTGKNRGSMILGEVSQILVLKIEAFWELAVPAITCQEGNNGDTYYCCYTIFESH